MESATSLEEAATIALKLKDTTDALEAAASELTDIGTRLGEVGETLTAMPGKAADLQKQLEEATGELQSYQKQLAEVEAGSLSAAAHLGNGGAQLASAKSTLEQSRSQLDQAREQYEDARQSAIEQANVDALVDKTTLANLIRAQDFSMPAGYLGNADEDHQWLLHVGDNIESLEALENLLLVTIDEVGDVRLRDVADITVVDNVGDAYMSLNGGDGVLLSVYKSSTASTNEVSAACREAVAGLAEEFPTLDLRIVSDQGELIDTFISSILNSLLLGGLLAVVVLALFLRDWKPTVLVAVSIPFSVLLALLLMYFTGVSANIMSLGGLSLAVGMLVDNSVVVLENIYRLRGRGISILEVARRPLAARHQPGPGGGSGRQADIRRRGGLHADHRLRLYAHRIHHGHGQPDDDALRAHPHLRAHRLARGGPHARAGALAVRLSPLPPAPRRLLREGEGCLRTLVAVRSAP